MRLAKLLILSTCLTGLSAAAQAQTCTTRPSCEALGYDMTETDCVGYRLLRCPFDATAVYCIKPNCPTEVTCDGEGSCKTYCEGNCIVCTMPDRGEFFDGRGNTQKIITQIGTNSLTATACNQFYPAPEGISSTDANFGAGKWYLPAFGELLKMYGMGDTSAVTSGFYTTGADASKGKAKVNNGLTAAGGVALTNDYYWSSSELSYCNAWVLRMNDGNRDYGNKFSSDDYYYVRCFLRLELQGNTPQIGDIMFSDKTWNSSVVNGKTPVGVVVDVYGSEVTIVNLKDLKFSNTSSANNFNVATSYTGDYGYTSWSVDDTNIGTLTDYTNNAVKAAIQAYQYW